jgi:16S rRNA (guanine527-N7)-methyltransferase
MCGPNRANTASTALAELNRSLHALTGRAATDRQRQQFQLYLDLLVRWNRAQRLTGLRLPAAIVQQLFQDSLLFLGCIPAGELKVADIGAGAGIPGVPLAIARPEMSMTLIESKRKRVSFLRAVQRELGAQNLTVIEGRAGSTSSEAQLEGAFDVVVSRGVGALPNLILLGMRYLKQRGVIVVSGPPIEPPRQHSQGGTIDVTTRTVTVPALGLRRLFLTATKKLLDEAE